MKNIDLNSETAIKIVANATELFNLNGYAGTSIADISKRAQISKGIIYHYFNNKDELYLYCSKRCIQNFSLYMEENTKELNDDEDVIVQMLKIRFSFFDVNPQYSSLLTSIISLKPNHLAQELFELKKMLRDDNLKRFKKLTKDVEFGKGITENDINAFLTILQNNSYLIGEKKRGEVSDKYYINTAMRITKIFINGLKEGIE